MGVEPRTARQMIEFGQQRQGHRPRRDAGVQPRHGPPRHPSAAELDRYFREVLEHVELPTVISTHFSVGYMIPIDLLCTLCDEYDSIIGINCSIGQDFTYSSGCSTR